MPIVNNGLEDAIRSHLKPWLNDHSEENTLLLTGERGIGKSSALVKVDKYLENEFADCRRITLAIPPKTTDPTAVLQLLGDALGTDLADGPAALVRSDEDRQPTVLVLEDAHNFFLRRVGGLEGWETFLSLTNARLQNIFWLIVLNNQSYAYLNNVYRAEYRFRSVIRARPWSQTEIRSLILSRHTKSGLSIRYDDVLLASRGPEAGNVRNAEQRYFSLLWDACRGNPMMALCLWMTSVTVTHDAVLAALPSLLKSAGLDRSGEDFLFVYATLVIHENLTAGEIVETTSISDSSVRAALKQGVDGGFVVRDEYRRYRIVPIWYPMVCAQLMRKNLLHE
jgi:DNA polymerase III delta prime subunit